MTKIIGGLLLRLSFFVAFLSIAICAARFFGLLIPYSLPTAGMSPTINKGDQIFVESLSRHFGTPHRGDIISFSTAAIDLIEKPNGKASIYLKRVVGLPEDRIEIRQGALLVNGKVVAQDLETLQPPLFPDPDRQAFIVPAGQYYVLGDNYKNSSDSRFWGCVPAASITGHYLCRYWHGPKNNPDSL